MLFVYQKNIFIEISYPVGINVIPKEQEKLLKYQVLAADSQKMYVWHVSSCYPGGVKVHTYRCGIIDHIRIVSEFSPRLFGHLQKAAIIETIHILQTIILMD